MARDKRGADAGKGLGSASDAELAARFDRFSRSLGREKGEQARAAPSDRGDGKGYALAFKLASEFVAGILVGAALGWGFDWLAGTSPWGLIVLLLLGFVAGVMNVLRAGNMMSTPRG